jgi:hypothetical protein
MSIEQRRLLSTMYFIRRIIDISKETLGRLSIRRDKGGKQSLGHPVEFAAPWGIFKATHAGLAGQRIV